MVNSFFSNVVNWSSRRIIAIISSSLAAALSVAVSAIEPSSFHGTMYLRIVSCTWKLLLCWHCRRRFWHCSWSTLTSPKTYLGNRINTNKSWCFPWMNHWNNVNFPFLFKSLKNGEKISSLLNWHPRWSLIRSAHELGKSFTKPDKTTYKSSLFAANAIKNGSTNESNVEWNFRVIAAIWRIVSGWSLRNSSICETNDLSVYWKRWWTGKSYYVSMTFWFSSVS